MKSFLVIGTGKFGHHLCVELTKYNAETMVIDSDEDKIDDLLPYVTTAKIGDCTDSEVLKSLGVSNFDAVFVCIGENFQNSLEVTSMVKELGAQNVISLATRDVHAKFLLRNGADSVIYPDRDIAARAARTYSSESIFDYFKIGDEYGVFEIKPFDEVIGKTIKDVNFRRKYDLNIIGYKKDGKMQMVNADYVFKADEHLLVVGENSQIAELVDK